MNVVKRLDVFVTVTLLGACLSAYAASGTWSGAQSANWTDSANWSASPYPSGGDTATFSGASANTTINTAGLPGILNIVFDTASVAAYTIGIGTSQTTILRDGGEVRITDTAGASQTLNTTLRLGPDSANAAYSLRNDHAERTLTVGAIGGMSGGTKMLNLNGVGTITVDGPLQRASSVLDITYNSSGVVNLNGNTSIRQIQINAADGVINLGAGTTLTVSNTGGSGIMAAGNCTINGPGSIFLSTAGGNNHLDNGAANGKTLTINAKLTGATGFEFWHSSYYGTIALMNPANDYTMSTIINVPATIAFDTIANGSTPCSLGAGGSVILNHADCRYLYLGTGSTSDRLVELHRGGAIEQGGSGHLLFTRATGATSGSKTLILQGSTDGTGEFSGGIMNDSGTVTLIKRGSGTWTISGASSYSGSTAIEEGTLILSGAAGAIASSASYTITNGATLRLVNTATANNGNRLRDASSIILDGGTLSVENDGSAANFSETAGALTVRHNASTLAFTPAAQGQSATLTFASLTRAGGGTLNITGADIGASDRARIFITGQPAGLIGSWITINGQGMVAYDAVNGLHVSSGAATTSIAARGPNSVIPDDAALGAEIDSDGTVGAITLAGAQANSIRYIRQNTATPAVIATQENGTHKTLRTDALFIGENKASVTVGEAAGDGFLAPLASGGNVILQNDDAAAVLTVNASIADNGAAAGLAKDGVGKALLTAANSYTGPTALGAGTLAFGGSVTQTIAGVISGGGTLTHEGSGKLVLTGANTYLGPTVIKSGMVLASNNAALGSPAAGTFIEDGGTLDVGGSMTGQAMNLNAEAITVTGAGVDGLGAIVNNSGISQFNALRIVTLAGDTTFGGVQSGRWDLRNVNGTSTLTMNNHTLTKVGQNMVGLTSVSVAPGGPAAAIDIREGSFTIEASTNMGGDENNVMTVRGGAYFDIYDMTTPTLWSLVLEDNARFYARLGNNTRNFWNGPVTLLDGQARLDAASACYASFNGEVTGPGSVVKVGAGTISLNHTANSYAGTTTISNGTLYVKHTGSLPGYKDGCVTVVNDSTLAMHASNGEQGWTAEEIRDLHDAAPFTGANACLAIDTSLAPLAYTYDFTNLMGLTKLGDQTLSLRGKAAYRGHTRINGGALAFDAPGDHEIGTLYVGNAHLFLTNPAPTFVYVTNNSAYVGYNAGDFGRMTVGGNTAWGGYLYPYNVPQSTLVIGQSGCGILEIQDNASITQRLYVGNNSSSHGAVYQNGGVMHNWGGCASDGRIGFSGYGYYELNSGTFTNMGYFHLGRNVNSVGILRQTGGAFEMGNVYAGILGLSRGGTAVVHTVGGTFNTASYLSVGEASDNGLQNGFAVFTADGDAQVRINGTINMADRTNMLAIANFNGGTVSASMITKSSSRTGSAAYVNFDGGTFLMRQNGKVFNTGANAPDAVHVYADGAAFDTADWNGTIDVPLQAPAGSGVASITVEPSGGYIGPPMVTIEGGGGTGATAIATFDSKSGTVSGIQVTCPGFGYTSAPSVTLSGGGVSTHNAATATLGANISGGLSKLGAGTLLLNAANTYGGATTVSNGTLGLDVAGALPEGSDIVLASGVLSLGGFTVTGGVVTAEGGLLADGHLRCDGLTKVGEKVLTIATGIDATTPIVISEGVLQLRGARPGLYEAPVAGAFNTTEAMSTSIVTRLTTRMANIVYTEPYYTTWIYKGYVWNRSPTNETWTFAENFDDNVKLTIDGVTVIANGVSWNVPTIGSYTLTPGPHAFEARFGQGGGGGGPVKSQWWTTTSFGFGVDFYGRNETNIAYFVTLTDPGDGSLLTTELTGESPLSVGTELVIAEGAGLDLNGCAPTLATLSGSGAVSNGTLMVTGTLAPGGVGTVGDLTLACDTTLTGALLIDIAAAGNDRLLLDGSLTFGAGATLTVANPELLDTAKQYTIATVSGGNTISGALDWTNRPNSHWQVKPSADGTLKLFYVSGSVMVLR